MAIFSFLKKKSVASKRPVVAKTKSKTITKPATEEKKESKMPPKKREGLAFKLLKEPHISEKSTNLSEDGKYIFKIYKSANKSEIKKAISNFYGVVVKNINIININTKIKLLKGKKGKKSGYKKAIVTLEKGHKIEILPH